jgi:hypothetical protein
VTATVDAYDQGLGLQHVGVMDDNNNWNGLAWHSPCSGNRGGPCPLHAVANTTLPSNPGLTALRSVGIDITDNVTFGTRWHLRRDADNPLITFGGEAWDHRSDGTLGYNPTLNVHVADDRSSSSYGVDQSGVNLVGASLDHKTLPSLYYDNPASSCTNCSKDFTVQLPILTPGDHTLQVSAVDYINRSGQTEVIHFNVRNDTSWTYGGDDHSVNTAGEAVTVGGLLAGAGYQAIWNGLSTRDKNYMLTVSDDPQFAVWAPRIDTGAPAAPDGIQIADVDGSARTAEVIWSEGSDADVSPGVFGSAVDDTNADYRYQRSGGSWTNWTKSDNVGFTLTSADPGDSITVQVREYDRAGNVSSTASHTVNVPSNDPSAHSSVVAIPVIACIEWCPIVAAGAGAAGSYFWSINQNHYDWTVVSHDSDIKITRSNDRTPTFDDAEKRAKSSSRRKAFRDEGMRLQATRTSVIRKHTTSSLRVPRPRAMRVGCSTSAVLTRTTSTPTGSGCPSAFTDACTRRTTTRPSTTCCGSTTRRSGATRAVRVQAALTSTARA